MMMIFSRRDVLCSNPNSPALWMSRQSKSCEVETPVGVGVDHVLSTPTTISTQAQTAHSEYGFDSDSTALLITYVHLFVSLVLFWGRLNQRKHNLSLCLVRLLVPTNSNLLLPVRGLLTRALLGQWIFHHLLGGGGVWTPPAYLGSCAS